ncbi:MAG: VOC family protein [Acidimicrobiales bacterium]
MPAIDHLVYASPDLDEGVHRIEQFVGGRAIAGGAHPGLGTRNALLGFDATAYFEIIGIDPEQSDPAWGRPFGLEPGGEPKLVAYAIHPVGGESLEDLVATLTALGFDPGEVVSMSRRTPEGQELNWRLTFPRDPASSGDGALPFAIDWGPTPSPAASLPSMGSLDAVRIQHPDARVRDAIDALDLGIQVGDGPLELIAVVDTPTSRVEIG